LINKQVAGRQLKSVLWSTRRQQVGFSILERIQSSDMLRLLVGLTCLWLLADSGSSFQGMLFRSIEV